MSDLYNSHSEVTGSSLKHFLDRKVPIRLRDSYVACFQEEFEQGLAVQRSFHDWVEEMCRQDHRGVTKGDAMAVRKFIHEA